MCVDLKLKHDFTKADIFVRESFANIFKLVSPAAIYC